MSFEEIQKALDVPLKTISFGGLPAYLENSIVVPDISTPFLTGTLLPVQPIQSELGPSGQIYMRGFIKSVFIIQKIAVLVI